MIDTGFTGHLTLSVELARSLALPELGSEEMVLADGRMSQRVAAIRGIARCGECGCALIALTSHYNYTKKDGEKVKHLRPYYRCATYRRLGREGCSMHRTLHAVRTEEVVWGP